MRKTKLLAELLAGLMLLQSLPVYMYADEPVIEPEEVAEEVVEEVVVPDRTVIASGECGDNITWTLSSDGLLELTGTGEMWGYKGTSGVLGDKLFNQATGLKIGEGITSIGAWAFAGYSNLSGELVLPDSLGSIGTGAFQNCSGFTGSLTIPAGMKNIGKQAFEGCSGFDGVLTIHAGSAFISAYAFADCSGITEICFSGAVPGLTGNGIFENMPLLTAVHVPAELYKDYMTALSPYLDTSLIVDNREYFTDAAMYIYNPEDGEYYSIDDRKIDREAQVIWLNETTASGYFDPNYSDPAGAVNFADLDSGWYDLILCGLGTDEESFPDNMEGKIAFCIRGDSTFTVKAENAMNAGAAFCLVGNNCRPEEAVDENGNVTGMYANTTMAMEYFTVPAASVSSDITVRLTAAAADISIAEAVAAVKEIYNGETELGVSHAKTVHVFVGTEEEYHAALAAGESRDINGDGVFDIDDALRLLRHTILPERYSLAVENADFDGNGVVDAADAVVLENLLETPEEPDEPADPYEGYEEWEGIYWKFDEEKCSLYIAGEGAVPAYPQDRYPWYEYRNVKMVEVVVEEGITELNASAIHLNRWTYSCLYLPSTLTYIDPVMLNVSGSSLKEIHMAEGGIYFSRDNVLYRKDGTEITLITYPSGLKNTSFTVPEDVDHIGDYSISSQYLTSLELSEGLQSIGAFAFRCCTALKQLEIPASVTNIEALTFHYCESLEKITVTEGNPKYVSDEGVLFTAGMDTLFAYPLNRSGEEYTVPDGVRCVLSPIAVMSTKLEVLYLPESVEEWRYLKGSSTPNVNLRAIYVDEANPYLTSENGILYSKDKSVLLQYPYALAEEEYRMPDTVTVMQTGSFQDTAYLSSIWWGKNLADTGWMNELGASVKEIYFPGDVPEWLSDVCWRAASSATLYYPEGNTTWTDGSMTFGKHTYKTASYETETENPYEGYNEWEGIYWKFDETAETLYIAGEGAVPNFTQDTAYPWYEYRQQIRTVDIGEGITEIPQTAVNENYSVEILKLPSTLENIDHTTFMYSTTLTDFIVADGGKYYDMDGVLFSATEDAVTLECYPYGRREQETIDSYTVPEGVTHLGLRAFNRSRIREIILPDSLVSIADHAIAWINELEKLRIPANVSEITTYSFWELYSLSEITIDEKNSWYEVVDGVLFDEAIRTMYLYPLADRRTSYTVPDTVVRMPGEPISVTANLTSITIPASVRNISLSLFSSNCTMQNITVASGNQYWSSVDGVLYNSNQTIMKYYPPCRPDEEFRIPDTVSTLGDASFYLPRYLKNLYVGENLTTVEHVAFRTLERVYFPGNRPSWLNAMCREVSSTVTLYYPAGNATWTDGSMTVDGITYKTASYDPEAEEPVPDDGYTVFENILWKFDETAGTLTIAGKGDMPDLASKEYPWSTLGYSVTDLVVEEGITSLTKNSVVNIYPYRVQYPSTLESAGQAFMRLNNQRLTKYTVAEGGTYYAVDGVLFSNSGNVRTLEHMPYDYPGMEDYVIPEGTTAIADYAMIYLNLGAVTFPDSLETIGYRALGYSSITSVTLGENVRTIDPSAFVGCTEVTAYTVDEDNPYFISENGILYNNIKTDMIAYPYRNGVTDFTVPDGVKEIPRELLYYSLDLHTLTLPASVISIISEGGSYDTQSALTAVYVDADNPEYSSADGVLYSADGQTLIYYPTCRTQDAFVIPSAVREVENWAIFGNQNLKTLVIPVYVHTMETAVNPRDCYNLTDIYFQGNPPNFWNNGDFQYLTTIKQITLHYPEGYDGWTDGTWTSASGYTFKTASYIVGTTPWTE